MDDLEVSARNSCNNYGHCVHAELTSGLRACFG